jgi:sorbitol-specific phosphotransferase system component IIC
VKAQVDAPVRWFIRRKANRWFVGMMLGVTTLLIILIIAIVANFFMLPSNQVIDP